MSVDDDLRRGSSTLLAVLDELLPARKDVVDCWRRQLRDAPCSPLRLGGDKTTAGQVMEIRLGLDLADRPAHWHALSYLSPERCEQVLAVAGYVSPAADAALDPLLRAWRRRARPTYDIHDAAHRDALASCYHAACLAHIGFGARHSLSASERRRLVDIAGEPDLGVMDRLSQVDALTGLAHLWQRYKAMGEAPS